jgi:hypothetical protein
MKAKAETPLEDEMRSEYTAASLKDGVRGKYVERYNKGDQFGLLAILRRHERSWLIILPGVFVVFLLLGEFPVQH